MATSNETASGQSRSMWTEAGIQFRSNLLTTENPNIALHRHGFDHVALITHGWVLVKQTTPDGVTNRYQLASKDFRPASHENFSPVGYRVLIPKWHQHSFQLIEAHDQPAEILCIYPENGEPREGC